MLYTRYTVRLPPALDTAVRERMSTAGTPFAVLIRDALSAYLADTPPPGVSPPAASPDTLRALQEQLTRVTQRVEVIEATLTRRRQRAATRSSPDRRQRPGRPKGPLRAGIDALLRTHPEGLRAEQIRGYLSPERPIGNILQGMRRTGTVRVQRQGRRILYFAQETAR
jgi:hypothetical protein